MYVPILEIKNQTVPKNEQKSKTKLMHNIKLFL